MEREDAIEILEQMRANIENDLKWLALDLAIEALEGQETKKNVVNVIPQECMKILSDAVMEAIRSIDWITLGEKMSERPTGEWKDLSDGWQEGTYECSNCKTEFVLTEGTPEDNEYHFCPNCGAKMREA